MMSARTLFFASESALVCLSQAKPLRLVLVVANLSQRLTVVSASYASLLISLTLTRLLPSSLVPSLRPLFLLLPFTSLDLARETACMPAHPLHSNKHTHTCHTSAYFSICSPSSLVHTMRRSFFYSLIISPNVCVCVCFLSLSSLAVSSHSFASRLPVMIAVL